MSVRSLAVPCALSHVIVAVGQRGALVSPNFRDDAADVTGDEVTCVGLRMNKTRVWGSGLSGSSFVGSRTCPVGMDTKD